MYISFVCVQSGREDCWEHTYCLGADIQAAGAAGPALLTSCFGAPSSDWLAALQYSCLGCLDSSSCACALQLRDGTLMGLLCCRLLSAALMDPLNQRFVLVSESCIPLHPPAVMWSQLMADNRSRINACADSGQDLMTWRSVSESRLTVLSLRMSGLLQKLSWGTTAVPFISRLCQHSFPAVRDRPAVAAGAAGQWLDGWWAAASSWGRVATEALRDAPAVAAELRGCVAAEVWLTSRRSIPILLYWRCLPALAAETC